MKLCRYFLLMYLTMFLVDKNDLVATFDIVSLRLLNISSGEDECTSYVFI